MAHAHKQSIGTAATLFADAASGDDFFLSLQSQPESDPHQDSNRQFSQGPASHQPADASDLFSSTTSTAVDSLWEQPIPTGGIHDWQQHHDGEQSHNGANYEYGTQDGYIPPVDNDPYANQGHYDEHGQWHEYRENQPGEQDWAHHANYDTTPAGNSQYASTSTYDYGYSNQDYSANSITASTHTSYQPPAADPYAPIISGQQPHDPYKPTTTNSYLPPTSTRAAAPTSSVPSTNRSSTPSRVGVTYATSQSHAYDPYKPTGSYSSPLVQQVAAPTTSYPYSTPQLSAPPPSRPAAEVYKATTYNAYDPPVVTKPRKVSKGHSVLSPPPTAPVYGYETPSAYGRHSPAPSSFSPPPKSSRYGQPAVQAHQSHAPPPPSPPSTQTYHAPVNSYAYSPRTQAHHLPPQQHPCSAAPTHIQSQVPPVPQWLNDAPTNDTDGHGEYGAAAGWMGYENGDPASHHQTSYESGGYDPEGGETDRYIAGDVRAVYTPGQMDAGPAMNGYHAYEEATSMATTATVVPPKRSSLNMGPPRKNSANSVLSLDGSPPVAKRVTMSPPSSHGAPRSTSGSNPMSPQDSVGRVGSPPVRQHSPAWKQPPRTTTPGSIRSLATSPAPRGSLETNRSEASNVSSPAAHLEAARSRIMSPESVGKAVVASPTPSAGVNGNPLPYDPYKPSRAATLPVGEPIRQGYDGPLQRASSPSGSEPIGDIPFTSAYDPYAPQAHQPPRRQTTDSSDHNHFDTQPISNGYSPYVATHVVEDTYPSRMSTESTYSAYVPSTSTTAGDDLLGRLGSRSPIISFGFGGKLVTAFPNRLDSTAGFDPSLTSRRPPSVLVRPIKDIVEEPITFPGPLFSDPGTPTVNITRTTASTVKAKTALVLKYLDEKIELVEREIGHVGPEQRSRASGKLCLVQILKILVENDGKISGSPDIDKAVQCALVPRLKSSLDNSASYGFTTPAANGLLLPGNTPYSHSTVGEAPVASYTVRSSVLDKIQEYLLLGEKRMAYRHALDERMWAHAMLIASSVGKDAWKEAVTEFVRTELSGSDAVNGRETLRVAYSMFAGQGYGAVDEMMPPKPLTRSTGSSNSLLIPPSPLLTAPLFTNGSTFSSGFSSTAPLETLSKWSETATVITSNATNGDRAALTALGDFLMANKWVEAAQVCYLLSMQASPLGGAGLPGVKLVLVGSEDPLTQPTFSANSDAFVFTEILEFALSLAPITKGQEPFSGVPHTQAYRLIHATQLAELGHISLATRYCEAIAAALRLSKPSPYYTQTFLEQLKELSDRLCGTPTLDKSGSWIARKMTKPSLASIGSWIESGVTKFIAGGEGEEANNPTGSETSKKEAQETTAGPFARFNVITSANTSPNASSTNLSTAPAFSAHGTLVPPPAQGSLRRSGSALAFRPYQTSGAPDRSASAMDMRPEPHSPYGAGPQIMSANAATTSFYQADRSLSALLGPNGGAAQTSIDGEKLANGNWWDKSSTSDGSAVTPMFYSANSSADEHGGDNFISPMATPALVPSKQSSFHSTPRSLSVAPVQEEDEEEDLGFGNSSGKKKQLNEDNQNTTPGNKSTPTVAVKRATPSPTPTPAKTIESPPKSAGGSWLPWKWGKKEEPTSPGPVKAKLGEENSFYYDKELKKWVNKKAGDDAAAAAAPLPPPPSRAPSRSQTASPGAQSAHSMLSRGATPPPRPQSTTSAPTTMSKTIPPRRSHLAESFTPISEPTSTPSTPGPNSRFLDPDLAPPPLSARSSAAAKRKGKSRYVDVFQQDAAGSS